MANLETLELTIQGTSNGAKQGIDGLVNSLSALSKSVGKSVGALKILNSQLSELKKFSKMRIPGADSAAKGAKDAIGVPETRLDALNMQLEGVTENMEKAAQKGNKLRTATMRLRQFTLQKQISAETAAIQQQTAAAAESTETVNEQGEETVAAAEKVSSGISKNTAAAQSFGSKASKAFEKVGRIAQTMLIRTALRSLIKSFSDSWEACYNFSKSMGGDFAASVDKVKALLSGTTTNLVASFAPALSAIVPIVSSVAGAIQYLCSAIQWLFSLLGMTTGALGATADAINAYSDSAKGGGGGTKEMLAAFDELNVISSEGGGGATGKGIKGMFADTISDELGEINAIVSESLLAIGLILACTGHVPLGVGLMAVGAAGMAKLVLEDWGKLSENVRDEIATIMGIVGASTLAIGAILAFSGHLGLGIGLMAIGAANLAGLAYVSWGGGISAGLRVAIAEVAAIVGGSMLALGAIFAFSGANIPLGIGLMLAGAGSLAYVAINWDAIVGKIKISVLKIASWLVDWFIIVRNIIEYAWTSFCKWLEPIIGPLVSAWNGGIEWLSQKWEQVTNIVNFAYTAVSQWWLNTKQKITGAWNLALTWLSNAWDRVTAVVILAWTAVSKWWSDIKSKIGKSWSYAITWLVSEWERVKSVINLAWTAVSKWFNDAKENIGTAWSAGLMWLSNTWNNLKSGIKSAWEIVEGWWKDNVLSKISAAWEGIQSFFDTLFSPIRTAYDLLSEIFGWNKKTVDIDVNINYNENFTGERTTTNFFGYDSGTTLDSTLLNYKKASGAYGVDRGDLFIANEAGAELVGSIDGKTSVANQEQIVEGISRGVSEANSEQNRLLRQQNELLRGILEKDVNVNLGASAMFGRTVKKSIDMYNAIGG